MYSVFGIRIKPIVRLPSSQYGGTGIRTTYSIPILRCRSQCVSGECERRMAANSPVYFEDRCNCFHYYVCHRVPKGWKAVRMSCPLCIMWSQKSHTCAVRNQTCLNEIAATNSRCLHKTCPFLLHQLLHFQRDVMLDLAAL